MNDGDGSISKVNFRHLMVKTSIKIDDTFKVCYIWVQNSLIIAFTVSFIEVQPRMMEKQ